MSGTTKAWIAAFTGAMLILALGLHLSSPPVPRDFTLFATAVIAGVPTAIRAFQGLRAKAFSIDLLVSIAVAGALVIGEYVEASVVAFLFIFGAWLEARVIRNRETLMVPVDEIAEGEIVVVHSGGKIPVDGAIVSGRGLLNEAAITGESVPVSKAVGGTVYTRAQRFLDRFANIYTPAIVVLSVLVLVLVVSRNVEFALTFLVIACPGALVTSTPVSMVAGLGNGARHGVLAKGGDALEQMAKIYTLVVDKSGILTEGKPRLAELRAVNDADSQQVLRLAAGLEQASEHPLGRTIVEAAGEAGVETDARPADVEVIKGGGIRGYVDAHDVVVGPRKVPTTFGIPLDSEFDDYAVAREHAGNTIVFATIDGQLTGIISIADQIRPEAAATIAALRTSGIKAIMMLTGDNRHTAALVGKQLGLDAVHAELMPADKVRIVQDLKDAGHRAAMIGDGINDAPAIATADVGVAMGAGTDVSIQTAGVILMGNRFDQLVHSFSLAKATVRNMKQNTVIAVGTVVLLLTSVLFQKVFMSTGMLIHEISVLVVILNAVRLVRYRDKTAQAIGTDTRLAVPTNPPTDHGYELLNSRK